MVSEIERKTIRDGIRFFTLKLDKQHPDWAATFPLEKLTTIFYLRNPECPGTGCFAFCWPGRLNEPLRQSKAEAQRVVNGFSFIPTRKELDPFYVECWHAEILSRRAPVSLPPKLLAKCVEMATESADYRLAK